jgi:DNA polymerase-3 subunit delta'
MLSPEELQGELIKRQIPAAEAAKIACLADGSLGKALSFSQHGGLELREDAVNFLAGLPEFTMNKLWTEAAAKSEMERERLSEWVLYINMLLRDMLLLYEDGASLLLYNHDLRGKLGEMLPRFSKGRLFAMLTETRTFSQRLQANVNLRLQLEGYFIRLMDCR